MLNTLDFETAAAAEAKTWRNLLPPEPWLTNVGALPNKFGEYTRLRLEVGVTSAPSVIVRARKPHQQTRPVPVVGIAERIAYRALCNQVLATQSAVDRSSDAYQRFIAGPIKVAFQGKQFITLSDVNIHYVIESDITAFYEYIDHHRLLDELQLRTFSVEVPKYLVQLLTEMQDRPFGLPQLLDPSDELSEIYARIIERELRRRGFDVWRYNDDFRMIATSYDEAQARVEALAREASAIGLVLNESKTRVTKFANYFWNNWLEPMTEGDIEFKPELIKASNDYGDLDDGDLTQLAHETFDRLNRDPGAVGHLNPADLSADDNHAVARAIGILTKNADPLGLSHVATLFEYAPHLSHRLGTYLVTLYGSGKDVSATWDQLVAKSNYFNAWQRIWLVYVARATDIMTDLSRRTWVDSQRADSDQLLRAEATLSLAPYNTPSFDEIDLAIRSEPEALVPWYALAAGQLPNVDPQRLQALKDSDALIEILL